jgi:NAD(P)-dependent dehydrogenase (short-subunit alcohol dehydrogenase family)
MPEQRSWLITGISRGFGRALAIELLDRGHTVVGTTRDGQSNLEAGSGTLHVVELDVTAPGQAAVAVGQAVARAGRVDVVVNNAGYGLFGAIEEITEEQARDQVETNLFGPLWVTQAVLPILREQGSGHIIQVSTIGGVNAFPILGLYHASKWGLEGFTQALAAEVAGFGIKVTLVEPAGYSTDWRGPSAVVAEPMAIYDEVRDYRAKLFTGALAEPGDPEATGPAILELVDADEPPLRTFFGTGTLEMIRAEYERRLETWEQWDHLAVAAQGGVPR